MLFSKRLILWGLWLGLGSVVLGSEDTEIFIYYNGGIQSSLWPPMGVNCTDSIGTGNSCHHQFSTEISRKDPSTLSCKRTCPQANISVVQHLRTAFIFVPGSDGVSCTFYPNRSNILRGITTTIDYNYYKPRFLWGMDFIRPLNCSLIGNYTSNVWTEERIFHRLSTQTQDVDIIDIVLLTVLCFTGLLIGLVLFAVSLYSCHYFYRNRRKTSIEYVGEEDVL